MVGSWPGPRGSVTCTASDSTEKHSWLPTISPLVPSPRRPFRIPSTTCPAPASALLTMVGLSSPDDLQRIRSASTTTVSAMMLWLVLPKLSISSDPVRRSQLQDLRLEIMHRSGYHAGLCSWKDGSVFQAGLAKLRAGIRPCYCLGRRGEVRGNAEAVLVRLESSTHAIDTESRRAALTPTLSSTDGQRHTCTLPSDGSVLLPEYCFCTDEWRA